MSKALELLKELKNNLVATATTATKIDEAIAELESERLDKPKEEWPKEGDAYWIIDSQSEVWRSVDNTTIGKKRIDFGNAFRTEERAKLERDRIKAMRVKWVPKVGDSYWMHGGNASHKYVWHGDEVDNFCLSHCQMVVFKRNHHHSAWSFPS